MAKKKKTKKPVNENIGRVKGRVYPDMLARRFEKIERLLSEAMGIAATYNDQAATYEHGIVNKKTAERLASALRAVEDTAFLLRS